MVASWRPDLSVQCAFNADPNDPLAIPIWSDLSSSTGVAFLGASNVKRGRQYELDQNQAAQPTLVFWDQYEYLNPANTASPYYPNVLPYREIMWQAQWPNTTVGNLLNPAYGANPVLGTTSGGYDPSFEAYTAAASVPWITAVGATVPVVGTTTPHGGTKDLTWSVAGTTTVQGVSAVLPCIPGRQYTTSAWVRQSSASTQQIAIGNRTVQIDMFARTAAGGWGTADVGGTYTAVGGVATDYSVTPGFGEHTLTTTNASRKTVIGTGVADQNQTAQIYVSAVATGAAIRGGLIGRYVDASNYYRAQVVFGTDSSVSVALVKRVAAAETSLATATTSLAYTAGGGVMLRLAITGTSLQARVWTIGAAEPSAWTVTATDADLSAAGQVGCWSIAATGNTNVNPVVAFASARCVGSIVGTSTVTTGAYVRLTATYTADHPTHTVQVATVGTAVAGTVLLDDVQHEEGASATTFTTTGPTIYGVFCGYVERWPAEWAPNSAGMLGICSATCVDALAALQRIGLWTEYRQEVLALAPTYYWPCNETAGTVFGEQSGNNGPPLQRYNGKYGAATFAPGTATGIAGDPSGVGLLISDGTAGGGPLSIAQTGLGGTPQVTFGATVPFTVTTALWLKHDAMGAGNNAVAWLATEFRQNTILSYLLLSGGPPATLTINSSAVDTGGTYRVASTTVNDTATAQVSHLYVYTAAISTTAITGTLWVDGVQVATVTTAATFGGTHTVGILEVGGYIDVNGQTYPGPPNGAYSHIALWNRGLSTAEIAALWTAGQGYPAERSGARIARLLSYGWFGRTSIATGASTMGASTVTTGQPELTACQNVNVTEGGNFWADRDGVVRFSSRNDRFLTTTAQYTFGEDTAGGEFPYQEDISFGYDPTFLFNDVTVSNSSGVNVTVTDPASIRRFFQGSTSAQVNTTDAQAIDQANWTLAISKSPHQRVAQIVLDPAAYPALWPIVLGMEINNRDTVKRRPKAANAGAGITMSQDYFVESISFDAVDLESGQWPVTLLLSPTPPVQPGILDDAVYGLLDSTFILAY